MALDMELDTRTTQTTTARGHADIRVTCPRKKRKEEWDREVAGLGGRTLS